MIHIDGTASCDRCTTPLPAHGVLHGMLCLELDGDLILERIFCYAGNCHTIAVAGLLNYTGPNQCTDCGETLSPRSVATAMITTDIDPDFPDRIRKLAFCYADSRDKLLTNVAI